MWRGEVRRGRAGQAFDFGEPGGLDGATAQSLAAGRHGPRPVGQIVKTKPLRRSGWRILDQSLEPREPALQATGRLSSPVRSPGFLKGGLDHPLPNHAQGHSRPIERHCGRRRAALVHALGESELLGLFHIARSFAEIRCPWFLSRLNETLALAPFPLGMVGRCPEAPISCSSRKAGLSDGYGPGSTTSGPRWLMGRCPSSAGAQHGSGSCSVQHNARAHRHKALPGQGDQNPRLLAPASPVFHVLHRVLGS